MIRVEGLCKSFGSLKVLENVNATIEKGECIALIGPSGTGKSVFLSCMNALVTPDSGKVFIDGVDLYDKRTNINKLRARMGMVYQNFNLFSHKTVLENIIIAPMKIRKMPREEAIRKAEGLLERVSLLDKRDAMPSQLSGGQKQRIAIARAMAMDPEIVLFDEPTSALDPSMVGEVLAVIRAFIKEGLTMVIVTHEMAFAREVADRIFYLDEKRIYETGTPDELFEHPKGEKTRAFVGRLKTLNLEVRSFGFDLLDCFSRIELFCVKYNVEKKRVYAMQLLFEEMIMYLLGHAYTRSDTPGIEVSIDYSERSHEVEMAILCGGKQLNPFEAPETEEELGLSMVQAMAKRTSYAYEDGVNRILLAF